MAKFLASRIRVFFTPSAWGLVLLGMLMFCINLPLPQTSFVNFPVAATVFQTAGLMFMVFGFEMFASMFMWPDISLQKLIDEVYLGSVAAALVILGLLIFNGMVAIAFVLWLAPALGAGVGPVAHH